MATGKNLVMNEETGELEEYVFGMSKDLSDKMKAKHDPEKQEQAQAWIEAMIGKSCFQNTGDDDKDYHVSLRDGSLLVKVLKQINKDHGGAFDIPKSSSSKKLGKMTTGSMKKSKCRENIVIYLNTCKQSCGKDVNGKKIPGMLDNDMFVTCDLFDNDNMDVVTDQIHSLGGKVQKLPDYKGPLLGTKQSDENKRQFTQQQLNDAKKIVPLQNAGSIHIQKNKSTDQIVKSTEVSVDKGGMSQQNSGSKAYNMQSGLDSIDKSGGHKSVDKSGESQQNSGGIAVPLNKSLDAINRNQGTSCSNVGSQINEGSIKQEHTTKQDSLTRGNN